MSDIAVDTCKMLIFKALHMSRGEKKNKHLLISVGTRGIRCKGHRLTGGLTLMENVKERSLEIKSTFNTYQCTNH